jgi:hypothetical protein
MMLPSLGHGHLIPFMQLAKKLAARGFTVTFVVTFHHKSSLQKKVEAARETGLDIHLVEMEIPRDDLAVGMLNSNSTLQRHQAASFTRSQRELMEAPFERFLQRFYGRRNRLHRRSAQLPHRRYPPRLGLRRGQKIQYTQECASTPAACTQVCLADYVRRSAS